MHTRPLAPIFEWVGDRIADYLARPIPGYRPATPPDFRALERVLQPGDVILVEGDSRVSTVIKYLTQSTWSHAAMYVGPIPGTGRDGDADVLVEANVGEGVVTAPLDKYKDFHVRVCRPVALTFADRTAVARFMIERIGFDYDNKNVFDLMRYLVPLPVPARFRRRMLAFGSGEPTRAICSTLIAQAFESVRYPILPRLKGREGAPKPPREVREDIVHIRQHTLYTPRDFDISPYFAIIKPTIETGFDYKTIVWAEDEAPRLTTGAGT